MCEQSLLGSLCPGEECQINDDCANDCCADGKCTTNSTGDANCNVVKIPMWAVYVLASFVVLAILIAIAMMCYCKKRHEEDIRTASDEMISKDENYQERRRSTASLRRSIASQKSGRDSVYGANDLNEILIGTDNVLPVSAMLDKGNSGRTASTASAKRSSLIN